MVSGCTTGFGLKAHVFKAGKFCLLMTRFSAIPVGGKWRVTRAEKIIQKEDRREKLRAKLEKGGWRAEDERAARGGNLIPSGKDEGRAGDFCSCCQVNLVVLLPRGVLRDPGTRVCVCVKGQELRAAEGRWHEVASFQTSAMPCSIRPKSCSGRSTHSNPVPNKTTDRSRWEWELWKDQPPMEWAGPAYQCLPFERSGTQKKEAFSHEENKRESKVLIKDKGSLLHSALYCDLNLLEVRAKRAANPN